jgi:hypothetical protein
MALYAPDKPGHSEAAVTVRTPSGASLTDTVTNDGQTWLEFYNTGSAMTVTITRTTNCNQGFNHPLVVTVPATTGNIRQGPYPIKDFSTTLTITWPGTVTGLTFGAVSLGGVTTGL